MLTFLSLLDWLVIGAYFTVLVGIGVVLARRRSPNAEDYFLGGHKMSLFSVVVSTVGASHSAATFLGVPDDSFRGNLTYLVSNIGALVAAQVVVLVFIPKFYALKVGTAYELLAARFGNGTVRDAGVVYLLGRIFANGARLYLASLAIAILLFGNVEPLSVTQAAFLLASLGFLLTFVGGIRSVILTDVMQCALYLSVAAILLVFLWISIPASTSQIVSYLDGSITGVSKLQVIDLSFDMDKPFTLWTSLTGLVLLHIAAMAMDQDLTQRLLTCKSGADGIKAVYLTTILHVPVFLLFLAIGLLLFVFYNGPSLMGGQGAHPNATFKGAPITVLMDFIVFHLPAGLKGLVLTGVIAAALGTLSSGLNSMASVAVQDFYLPIMRRRLRLSEAHEVRAGQFGMAAVAVTLFGMACLCLYLQRASEMPLLEFALSVMTFSYSGLLGVFATALFTHRGSSNSARFALAAGFLITLAQQKYVTGPLGLDPVISSLAFPWQLCIGASASFLVCAAVGARRSAEVSCAMASEPSN